MHCSSPASLSSDGIAPASGASNASGKVSGNAGAPAMAAKCCRLAIALTTPAALLAEPLTLLQFFYQFVLLSVQLCFAGSLQGLSHIFLKTLFADFFGDDALLENLPILDKFLDERFTILHAFDLCECHTIL